jgi:hypothetical protein
MWPAPDVERAVAFGLEIWGAGAEALNGWKIEFTPYKIPCRDDPCDGCAFMDERRLAVRQWGLCPEQTALIHEIGHAVIGDPEHRDPRWAHYSASLYEWLAAHPECGAIH